MRLIPSISPEASVSGQGKQGRTPSGAHQCCSASSASRAAGEAALSTSNPQSLLSLALIAVVVARGTHGKIEGSCYLQC